MCDTFVVLPQSTDNGSMIFGKNSDREPNEPHYVEVIPAAEFPEGSCVQCTYISIPQARRTNQVLLCKPVWIWGAEMGANEHGVVIGNEAVFSKLSPGKTPGLIGMDYLRLALERSNSASTALEVIIDLLSKYDQSGNCGFSHPFYYHNSYLIADKNEAWKLETVGKQWAAIRIKKFGAISNALTINEEWDLASDDLIKFAMERGWTQKGKDFNFAEVYSDRIMTFFSDAKRRQSCTTASIASHDGGFTVKDAITILRNHKQNTDKFRPDRSLTGADVCMHAGAGPVRISQTTGSLVASVKADRNEFWVTGSSAPCVSLFKPFSFDLENNPFGDRPQKVNDLKSYWWKHECIHRKAIQNYPVYAPLIKNAYQEVEDSLFKEIRQLESCTESEKRAWILKVYDEAWSQMDELNESLRTISAKETTPFLYRNAWKGFNKAAKCDPEDQVQLV